jgi:ribosomal protein S18 acetylase RimI-like enzyme
MRRALPIWPWPPPEDLGFPVSVQVSPAESHLRLDETLEARGMTFGGASLVLAGPPRCGARASGAVGRRALLAPRAGALGNAQGLPGAGDGARSSAAGGAATIVGLSRLTSEWVDAWAAVSGIAGTRETAELVLSQLGDRARFAVAVEHGTRAPVAVAFGVVEDQWLGLFSLATSSGARRVGIASSVVDALERWAATRGAQRSYLQVEADNAPALSFYAARGFHIAHSYHYRSG